MIRFFTSLEPIGHFALREEIANLLSQYNVFVGSGDVVVTNGCMEALSIAIRVVTQHLEIL